MLRRQVRRQIIICILILGVVFPFIDYLVITEAFFLFIPLTILLFGSVALFFGYFIWDRNKLKKYILSILSVPIFVAAQFISNWTVDNIQRYRSGLIIKEIENIKSQTGQIPGDYQGTLGIKFLTLKDKTEFKLNYSRGFMVTEYYYSKDKSWRSQGWND
jgi:membrane-bound ClpP family serine protease